jgi:ring-1,2-phenylacetyl-CoA epoxidase subunit PaaD
VVSAVPISAIPLEEAVRAALHDVHDPEIPQVSVVDLGVVHEVHVGPGRIRVELLPTFVGCPAVDLMRIAVEERLAAFGAEVEVAVTYDVAWTSDRITDEGRRRLAASGFAPPGPASADDAPTVLPMLGVTCPHCGSVRTRLENAFGPTLCRSIHHCADCRQPFEAFKPV